MKKIDVTQKVMNRIVRFEKRRIGLWIFRFAIAFLILAALSLAYFLIAFLEIRERKTLELLTLFNEDREIIAEFWQDTLQTFFDEMPLQELFLGVVFGVSIVILALILKIKLPVIRKKIHLLAKYQKRK